MLTTRRGQAMATPTLLKLTKRERAAIDSYLEDQAATPLPPK